MRTYCGRCNDFYETTQTHVCRVHCLYCQESHSKDDIHECDTDLLRSFIDGLSSQISDLLMEKFRLEDSIEHERRHVMKLYSQVKVEKEMRTKEREHLTKWLHSRIKQQQSGLLYMSGTTQKNLETEISFLKRYVEIIEKGQHQAADPLLPKFEDA